MLSLANVLQNETKKQHYYYLVEVVASVTDIKYLLLN